MMIRVCRLDSKPKMARAITLHNGPVELKEYNDLTRLMVSRNGSIYPVASPRGSEAWRRGGLRICLPWLDINVCREASSLWWASPKDQFRIIRKA